MKQYDAKIVVELKAALKEREKEAVSKQYFFAANASSEKKRKEKKVTLYNTSIAITVRAKIDVMIQQSP